MVRTKTLNKGDFLLKEGQICRDIAYIQQGLFMYYTLHNGEIKPADFGEEQSCEKLFYPNNRGDGYCGLGGFGCLLCKL